ncbi:MAG: hypothetical protein E6Q97_28735 [Desulfurellales bacterium]|nr:MAG: hypothetical protein E6Q97_28735 [Desulfurellales bacterium]
MRTQLREVEDKILRAAPGAMAAGGGDIEAAMKSPKVPVTLKAKRKKLQDQLRAAQPAGESGDGIKLTPAQKREIEAGGTGFVGELGESARSSLQAMRNNPKVPVIKTDANGSYFNDELPQYADIGSGFSVRGYSVRGDVVQDIKLPNGMVIQRKLKADGSVTGSAEGNYDQIVEGKGFAEAEKLVADYFAGRRPEAQTRALPAPKVEDGSTAVERAKNGYAKVKIGRAQHFVTPYNDHFVIRDRQGNIVRGSDSRQLQFATESEAISYAEKSAASTPSLGADDITMLVRKAAHADERPGDVMLQTYEPTFITLEQAVAFARQYMSPSDWDKPFQFNRVLDIAPRDWGRMVKAMASANNAATTEAAPATTEAKRATTGAPAPSEIDHNGTRIYQTKIRLADTEPKLMWAVESATNKAKRMAGERTVSGDTLHDSLDQAKAAADREAQRDAAESAYKAELEAQDKARQAAEEARKAENRGKSVVERRKDAILDGPSKIGQGTKRAVITSAVDNGYAIEAKMVYDYAARKRDQETVDRASRAGYILGVSNENLPLVKAGNEAKARLKEGKYEKPEYRVYQGSDTNAPFREITKTEYDYAQELKAQRAAAQQAEAAPAASSQQATDDFLPEGWTKSINGYTKRPVYRMEQGGGQPFAVVTQVEGMQYEMQIRHGDKQLTVSNQTGALSEVLAKAEAELTRMTQADSVTHQDPGEKPEAATKAVVSESIKTAARNEDTKPSEMRKWLLAEIEKEMLAAPDRADYDETVKRVGEKDAISMYTGSGMLGKNTETGFITFDVPGDGKFKVRNSMRGLLEFRKNVNASGGFKDSGQKTVRPPENKGALDGGSKMDAITNMIEEGDFEAARDYAEAVGIKLDDVKVPKGDRKPQWDAFRKNGTLPPEPFSPSKEWKFLDLGGSFVNESEAKQAVLTRTADGSEYVATVNGRLDGTSAKYAITKDGKQHSAMTSRASFGDALRMAEEAMPAANDKPAAGTKTASAEEAPSEAGAESGPADPAPKGRTYLLVPFEEKDLAKVRGAKWDAEKKVWYADPISGGMAEGEINVNLTRFIPEDRTADDRFNYYGDKGIANVVALNAQQRDGVPRKLVKRKHPDEQTMFWSVVPDDQKAEPSIPEGYKPAGEPFYREGKLVQGYAPFNVGDRVTVKDSGGQSGVVESLTTPDENGVFDGAMVKFDNGSSQIVKFGKLEEAEAKRFVVPDPPTWDYRLKRRGGSTYLIPPVGQAFTLETRRALRDWARDAGFFASIITDNEISVDAVTGGPSLDYIVDGVEDQKYERQAAKERAATQAATGTRRDPTKVSMFNPYEDGDIVSIDGQDWTVKQDTPGWYLTNTGNWRGTHPTIRNIKAMADLIREVEQASVAQKAAAPQADTPKLTHAEAKALMEWQDMGQTDGIKKHALHFYESQANKDANRGRMTLVNVTKDTSASNWFVEGDDKPFAMLGMAKKRAEELGMLRAMRDGFVLADAVSTDAADEPAAGTKTDEQKAYQDSFEMPSQSVMAKKPTPASIDNWSNPVEWHGKTVYTNGHFVDVTGTPPHLKNWESRKGVRQNLTTSMTDRVLGMAGVRDGFPDSSHVKADPLAVIDDAKSGRLFFDVQGELVGIDLKYARYFHSKVKGVTFTANPKDLGGPLRVMDGDNLVGIVMPIRYDKSLKMTVADVRGYMASSGKDKPQSVVKRAQQAKEQEAKPAETPAEDAADVFPMQEAASSYSGISHSGTQRAKSDAAEFEAYIERANAAGLALAETDEQKAAVEQATKSLRADYLVAYRRMMGVRAGTYSGFVAGRSGLNAKQADRSNSAYDRAIDAFVSWQKENDNRVRRAALDARTDEAKQADIDAARAADDQKAQAKEDADLTLMRKILNWKKGGEPVAIGKAANLNGVNLDKAGYPSSVKLSPTDGSTLSDDKFDLAALFRRKGMSVPDSKRRVRELVDAVRAEDGAQVAAAKAEPAAKTEDSKTPTVDRHMEVMEGVRAGTATPEQFKASFNAVVDGKEAILAELDTKTKVELLRAGGAFLQMRYASEKKSEVAEAFYLQMVGEYTLGEGVTYGLSKGSYEAAVRRIVEATDEAKLKSYLEERKAAVAEALARRAARVAAITNPQTLADFREVIGARISDGMSQQEAFLTLTPEQRIKYDTLAAESTRERREEIKRKAKTQVATAGNTSASEVIATKHTKLGHDLFVVKLANRVERDEYLTLNNSAKRLGGSYSSFRGNGAIPGFQFRNREAAEAFRNLVDGDTTQAQELAAQRRDAFEDDRSQTAVERLRAMAEKLEAQAEEEENRERKTNTAKRARYASSALAGAAADKAKAKTMRNIADAIEAGNAKFLDEVRTKTQVDMLTAIVATAKSNELRAKHPSYADQEKRRGEPPTAETADFAEFPSYASFRSDLASLARQMLEVEGTKKLGQRLMSVADDVTDTYLEFAKKNISKVSQFGRGDAMADFSNKDDAERAIRRSGLTGKAIVLAVKRGQNRVILSPSEAIGRQIWSGDGDKRITLNGEFGAELVEAIGRRGNKQNRLTVPWQFQNTYDRRKALSRLGIETASEYRSALREFIALKEQALVNRTREMELQMVGRKADGLDFFPTSAAVADQMIEAADLSPDMAVLEPSAGMGHLADRIREAGAEPDVIEISGDRRELLEEKGYHLAPYNDFLQMEPRKFFTYGDVFRAPDGTEGTMRGVGRMGSQRVRLEDENGNRLGLYDRDELTGIGHRGSWSGYDRIIMNPPFSNRRDAEHVMHAYTLLRPGGRIVAIMGEGVFFGQDKKAQEFRDWLESVGGTSEKLPAGSFMDPSLPVNTSVNARMVVIDKPAGDLVLPSRDDAGAGVNAFRTTRAPGSTQAQLSLDAVKKTVESALRRVVGAPTVQVVARPEDIGLGNPFASVPKGATLNDGSVVVFSDGAESVVDVYRTVFHELFHRGSKVRFERNSDYITKMLTIAAGDETVRAEVASWKKSDDGLAKMSEFRANGPLTGERLANYEAIAVEEALATMAERIGMGELTQPQDVIKRIARFLARVADAWGMTQLSHWLRNQSTSETEKFVMETIAMSGGKANTFSTALLFNTSQSADTRELADLFKALEAPRGLKLTQAYRAVDQHPLSSKIREVESNFLDILERLDDAGLVQINC